jgi:hypothetical protein
MAHIEEITGLQLRPLHSSLLPPLRKHQNRPRDIPGGPHKGQSEDLPVTNAATPLLPFCYRIAWDEVAQDGIADAT